MITINPQYFREPALFFQKHKKYDQGEVGSEEWREYWRREIDRSINGYSVGGMKITGNHYFYLNYCPIIVTKESYGSIHKSKSVNAKKVGERVEDFADFWDVDYMFFMTLEIAKKGISIDDYRKLPIDLGIDIKDRSNINGGKHFVWFKPRGVGASYKGASLPTRDFFLVRLSKSFLVASQTEYLTKDGIFTKFLSYRSHINTHCSGFAKNSDVKKDMKAMHFRASYIDTTDSTEKGYMSEVMGLTLNNDPQKARGKRGSIYWEEAGKFPGLDQAWNIARRSVEELGITFATMVAFGTGGVEGSNFESLEKMIYNPDAYNILAFDNIYDEGMEGTTCGFFTPAYKNIQYKDTNGNSNEEAAKRVLDAEEEILKKQSDPNQLIQFRAENPRCIQDGVLNTASNIFPVNELRAWKLDVEQRHLNMGIYGTFSNSEKGVEFKMDMDLKPIYKYPHDKRGDTTGCVVKYQNPFKIEGKIPDNLYILMADTYRHDESSGDSIGAMYVMMNLNNLVIHRGDVIVASYVGRPKTQEDYNRIMFQLAEYFNAKIAFENDEPGDVIGYAKRHKKLTMLAEEFELAYDANLQSTTGVKRGFGMHMGSGKDNKRILQGDIFIKEWLLSPRNTDEDGVVKYNLHTIYDPALLEELIKYRKGGNYDRIAALRVGMYHQRELLYKNIAPRKSITSSKTSFFNHKQFV